MYEVINNSNVTYKDPSHEAMRSALLDAVKSKVQEGSWLASDTPRSLQSGWKR
jgi:hypothetical protein